MVVVKKQEKNCRILDEAIPEDTRVGENEDDKTEKHLSRELRKMWNIRARVIPIVIGALGTVPRRLPEYLRMIGVGVSVEMNKKTRKDRNKDHGTVKIAGP